MYIEKASNVWNDLCERFSQGDLVRACELQQEINSFKRGSMTVPDFSQNLKQFGRNWNITDKVFVIVPQPEMLHYIKTKIM